MAKKSKSAPFPELPIQDGAGPPAKSSHVPARAQPLPPNILSPSPLVKLAKDKAFSGSSGDSSKELWLIQVPRNVRVQRVYTLYVTSDDGSATCCLLAQMLICDITHARSRSLLTLTQT
jgi:hypothetical protein